MKQIKIKIEKLQKVSMLMTIRLISNKTISKSSFLTFWTRIKRKTCSIMLNFIILVTHFTCSNNTYRYIFQYIHQHQPIYFLENPLPSHTMLLKKKKCVNKSLGLPSPAFSLILERSKHQTRLYITQEAKGFIHKMGDDI
jgi:hypothetical protein